MQPVRIALVGCGKVGQIHASAVASLAEAELVAVCDAISERSETLAARLRARAYTDTALMLREARPEVVLIGTPHPLHAEPAILAADAGVHVLVEKPMAANLRDCDAMLAAARKTGTLLGVISQRRWYEPVQRLRAAIDAGKIGRPALGLFLMYSWREQAYYQSDPWRGKWDSEGGGVLVNQSPHQLDLLRWFMGPIAEVSGYWANVNHPGVEVDDTAVAVLRFQDGGIGSIVTSVAQQPGIYTKVHVHGSNGASVGVETDRGATFIAGYSRITEPPLNDLWTIPGEEHLLPRFRAEDRERFERHDATTHYHALQIQDFLQAVRQRRPPLVTGEDGRATVELFTAIYLSNRERRSVGLPLCV
ncbi:MAG: Gfo/Idh/MocA family oxidoreductase [Planctomycetes bacterium]|nr:Gfo/Idh/MocA family oxidoreductase [Planctomycetota bacterium]